jgi:predicted nucleotidyltransferase
LPREYGVEQYTLPAFDKDKRVTERVTAGLENTLFLYNEIGRRIASETENNPSNLAIKEVLIVGSCARKNRVDSDLDLLLIAPDIDEETGNQLKTIMSYVLFCDRSKQEAIDVL